MIGLSVDEALEILRRLMVAMPRNYELHRSILVSQGSPNKNNDGWIISFMEPHFTGFQAVILKEALEDHPAVGYAVSTNVVRIFKKDSP